jgi:hypothetical protein
MGWTIGFQAAKGGQDAVPTPKMQSARGLGKIFYVILTVFAVEMAESY